jgi:predicted RNA binding protein YcfA (HicA-like mRNA interferase family)
VKKTELLKKITALGAVFVRHGGNHDVYVQPATSKESAVPRHSDVNEYTAKSILKKLS